MDSLFFIAICSASFLFTVFLLSLWFRVVVETNKVHIVQSRSKTTSYGTNQKNGNAYYKWPSWLPLIGVNRIVLPVSNFGLHLQGYKAYDKERVPFELDLTAFFRICDTNKAAERVVDTESLQKQLEYIVQGAARKILASHDIHQIMTDRATFGQQFTEEVKVELSAWGVEPVKNMELMDIRDADNSKVITNIMAKKASYIAMESRSEVARNNQIAETAEIEAKQTVDIRRQDAERQVGERIAEKDKAIGVAQQKSQQEIKTEEAATAQKQMEIARVEQVKQAEINKEAALVSAEQQKQVAILDAEGQLEATKRNAEGIKAEGQAKAAAEQAIQLAPVHAQIELAREIGENKNYQQYLIALKAIETYLAVGSEQAKALTAAEIKVIANASHVQQGLSSAMEILSPKGGTAIGGMLEALKQIPEGDKVLELLGSLLNKNSKTPEAGANLL